MVLGYMQTKKIPRILLAQGEEETEKLSGMYVIWPDRTQGDIYDLSLSGMSISAAGMLAKVRNDQSISLELRIAGLEDTIPLKARIVQIRARSLGILFESISAEGRLILEQTTKDRLVVQNLKRMPQTVLNPQLRGDVWLHGPFDTNIILWKSPDQSSIHKALVEYDNLIWIYENGEVLLQKSSSAVDQSQGYFNTSTVYTNHNGKVSMGASWPDRLMKVLDQANERQNQNPNEDGGQELARVMMLLRQQRGR